MFVHSLCKFKKVSNNVRKIMKKLIQVALSGVFAVSVFAAAAQDAPKGDAAAGKVKAVAICSGCHGVPGTKSSYPEVYLVPKLGNQQPGYLYSALKSYKAGTRYNSTMKAQASALSDKEMADLAAYYGKSASQPNAQTAAK